MKKLFSALILLQCLSRAWALPTFDPFTDATASGGTAYVSSSELDHQTNALGEGWARLYPNSTSSTTNAFVTCVNSNLSYSGFPAGFPTPSATNAIKIPGRVEQPTGTTQGTNGIDAALNLSRSISADPAGLVTNKVFASFLMQVPNLGSLIKGSSIYFSGFATNKGDQLGVPNGTLNRASKIFLTGDSTISGSSTHYAIGVSDNTGGSSIVFEGATNHTTSDVLFVVLDYEFNTTTTGDFVRLWINPVTNQFGTADAPTPSASMTNTSVAQKLTNAACFYLLTRGGGNIYGDILLSNLRIGTTWSYVTGGPEITTPPVSRTNIASTTATFQVSALSGSTNNPLSYQWQKNGANLVNDGISILGATTATLTISNITQTNAGNYTVIVSNLFGSVTSSAAVLTTIDPYITVQPAPTQNQASGSTANFTVTATGSAPLMYQWAKDGANLANGPTGLGSTISGATTAHLAISSVSTGDSGTYTVTVTNGFGSSMVSSNAILAVNDPVITSAPQNVTANYSGTAGFSVAAAGTLPLSYRWQKDGVDLVNGPAPSGSGAIVSGANSTNLVITGVAYTDLGSYTVTITNGVGTSVNSSAATLTVIDPVITTQPVSRTNLAGTSSTFAVLANGTSPITYQWQKNGVPLSDTGNITGSTTTNLAVANVSDADVGSYTVVVSGTGQLAGTQSNVVSQVATLTVLDPITITNPPQSRVERVGDNMAFAVGALATAPTFQWQLNGSNLSGATSSSLVLTNIQLTNAGTYTVIVSNQFNSTTNSATLTVSSGLMHLSPTNLVVARVGDGAQPLNDTNGNTLYLDQFMPNGGYLSTIMIPNSGTSAFIVEGGTRAGIVESVLTRSTNQQFLNFAGYNLSLPNTNTTFSGSTPIRAIGAVNGLGYYTLCLTNSGLYNGGEQVRSAVSTDGLTNFWTTGSGGGGIKYLTPSQPAAGIPQLLGGLPDPRLIDIFNGNLYFTSGSSSNGLFDFTGLPTAATNGSNVIWPTGNSPVEFSYSPDGQTVYISDDSAIASGGGIQRWDNGSLSYTLATGSGSTVGARGLTVDFSGFTGGGASGIGAVVYTTTAESSANRLLKILDNGSSSTATLLAVAGSKQLFRGIRFGPVTIPVSVVTPLPTQAAFVGDLARFSAGVAGSAPLSYQWQLNGTNVSGATQASLVLTNLQFTDAGTYSVVVSNDLSSVTNVNGVLQVNAFTVNTNLAAYLALDDASGLTAVDSSGNGNNGTLQNFPGDNSEWISGRIGGGLILTNANAASNNVVVIPDAPGLNFTNSLAFTLSAWVRSTGSSQLGGAAVIAKGFGGGGEQYAVDFSGNNFRFYVRTATGTAVNLNTSVTHNRRWQHVVASFDSSQGIMKLYINGLLAGSATPPSSLLYSTNEVSIGNRKNSSSSAYNLPFTGVIDDVRIYKFALSSNEVQTLYGAAGGLSPVAYTQPQGATVYTGDNITFTTLADGTDPLTYQWKKNSANIPGATNGTLSLTNLHLQDAGTYTLLVTNLYGIAPSSNAVLQILPISIGGLTSLNDGSIQFTGSGKPNSGYHILATTNVALPTSQWTVLISGAFDGSGQFTFTDQTVTTNYPDRFYIITVP